MLQSKTFWVQPAHELLVDSVSFDSDNYIWQAGFDFSPFSGTERPSGAKKAHTVRLVFTSCYYSVLFVSFLCLWLGTVFYRWVVYVSLSYFCSSVFTGGHQPSGGRERERKRAREIINIKWETKIRVYLKGPQFLLIFFFSSSSVFSSDDSEMSRG